MFFEIITAVLAVVECIKLVVHVAERLGLFDAKGNPEKAVADLGDRAIQAEKKGITRDKFDTYDEYKKQIEAFELDPNESKQIPEIDKQKKGLEMLVNTLEFNKGIKVGQFLDIIEKDEKFFTKERFDAYVETFSENKIDIEKVPAYFEGTLNDIDRKTVYESIFQAERRLDPSKSLSEIEKTIEARIKRK